MITSSTGPAEIVLVRHGESLGNVADREARGRRALRIDVPARDADVELSPTGEHQADAVGAHLARLASDATPTAVLSSPYRRARATAERALATWPDAPPLRLDERLRERELGAFDGLTGYGITAEHPDEAARREHLGKFYYRPPSGESWCDVALRVRSLLADARFDHDGARLWVFSHQAVIMAFRVVLEGLSESEVLDLDRSAPLANCSLSTYRRGASGALELVEAGSTEAVDASPAPVTREDEPIDAAVDGGAAQPVDSTAGQAS
ncbi:MAG TPA: histidine phosphatase family protein [Actinomycetales bacterium]